MRVGDVREEDGDGGLVATLTPATQLRPQYSLEVGGLPEDEPVYRERYSLSAVESHVSPPLRSHVLTNIGDHQAQVMALLHQ